MIWRLLLAGLCASLPFLNASAQENSVARTWPFDDIPVNQLPSHFILGTFFDGRPSGDWKVITTPKALSPPQVLAQLRDKNAEHNYNMLLVDNVQAANLDLVVSFLPISGRADMGGGLIWRAQDDRNYYLARANPLEQNIRIYRVVKGFRRVLKNFDRIIDVRKWHTLRVVQRGCQVQVVYDGEQVFDLCDETFKEGQIGLWTKSDAVTYFDDLRLVSLP
jgi:hypothetical protein